MLLSEGGTHRQRLVLRAQAVVGLTHAPDVGLGVEVGQIGKAACSKKVLAHVANGALHAALLVAPGHGHRAGLKVVVAGKRQQLRREANGVAPALQHGTLEVVIEQHARKPTPELKGLDMASQEALHARVQ